jgi:hypothetical protein
MFEAEYDVRIMKTIAISLLLFLSTCVLWADEDTGKTECLIKDAPTHSLDKELERSRLSKTEKELVSKRVSAKTYKYFSVERRTLNGETQVIIDQYSFDHWTNSKTGEKGKSPHGSRTTYTKTNGVWFPISGNFYGG